MLWTPEGARGTSPLILLGHGGGQHKGAPGIVSRARCFAAAGFAVVAIDAPNHGDRPQDEEFGRIAAGMRAGMAAGENPSALVAGMHSYLAWQAVADWQAVLTAVQCLGQVRAGPEAVRRVLGGMITVAGGIAELRNRGYGTGHGPAGKRVGLRPRHVRLAVNAAVTWCTLVLDTLAGPEAPWQTACRSRAV